MIYMYIDIIIFKNVVLTGEDYDIGPYNITFPAGMTIVSLSIPIIDDNILEGNENFTLMIDPTIVGDNYNETTVVILDDDCKIRSIMHEKIKGID